ncbi:hypothetical protein SPF06_09155 [Sinomonas sp. JGH33]|uniref:Uncharacterized protein n=1 Tax=Sinomonas terricola TaxID=3110330 RepID=A0ABU5T5E6_9MICC|nr:hypothetical protein [Sinomonas sp. JGH33]MEA5454888.1 hypothetical protein [Sinomonas sp. JGH33]
MKARGAVLTRRSAQQAPLANWAELRAEDQIEIVKHAQVVATGRVEEVSLSGNVLWIEADGDQPRRLFLKSDGVLVRRA